MFIQFLKIYIFFIIITFAFSNDIYLQYSSARNLYQSGMITESYPILYEIAQKKSDVRDFAMYYLAKISQPEQANKIYLELLKLYPKFIFAKQIKESIENYYYANNLLKEEYNKNEIWLIAERFHRESKWKDSNNVFLIWHDNYFDKDKYFSFMYYKAINYLYLNEYNESEKKFTELLGYVEHNYHNDIYLYLLKIMRKTQGDKHTINFINKLIKENNKNMSLIKPLLLEKVSIYVQLEKWKLVEKYSQQYLDFFPDCNQIDSSLFYLGRYYYLANNFKDAEQIFNLISHKDKLHKLFAPVSKYMITLLPDISAKRKNEIYLWLYENSPWTYYGHLASKHLGKTFIKNPEPFIAKINITEIDQRVLLFESLGDNETASIILRDKYFKDRLNMQLALYLIELYERQKDYYKAIGIANTVWLIYQNRDKLSELPSIFWEKVYPLYYYDIVKSESLRYNIDPFLILSIIKQESMFDSKAISRSNARGLMQLMIPTAEEVAKWLRLAKFDLNKPEDNIKIGVRYYNYITLRYPENEQFALASYNAGPNRAIPWVKQANKQRLSPIEFAEIITLNEPRNYVKVVLRNYWNYLDYYK
jgi:soluble lytic murein transglycosylase